MALRPVFISADTGHTLVHTLDVEFKWIPGQARSQVAKRVLALHEAAATHTPHCILEISQYSEDKTGIAASAFNLAYTLSTGKVVSLESVFQGSKIFSRGGPYLDLYGNPPRHCKRDERLTSSGPLIGFRIEGLDWPMDPPTAFYDWLYINCVQANPTVATHLAGFSAFTDIAFNPAKSINCQARRAALFKTLYDRQLLDLAMSSQKQFLETVMTAYGEYPDGELWH